MTGFLTGEFNNTCVNSRSLSPILITKGLKIEVMSLFLERHHIVMGYVCPQPEGIMTRTHNYWRQWGKEVMMSNQMKIDLPVNVLRVCSQGTGKQISWAWNSEACPASFPACLLHHPVCTMIIQTSSTTVSQAAWMMLSRGKIVRTKLPAGVWLLVPGLTSQLAKCSHQSLVLGRFSESPLWADWMNREKRTMKRGGKSLISTLPGGGLPPCLS